MKYSRIGNIVRGWTLLLAGVAVVPTLHASVVAYPAKGQSAKQQETDQASCAQWAKKQTGIDPAELAKNATQAPQTSSGGEAVKGAGRGAAAGAIGGAIAGDAGKGAAIGAGVGGAAGVAGKSRSNRQAQQEQQQAQAKVQQQLAEYEKAEKTCLSGKGYSVS